MTRLAVGAKCGTPGIPLVLPVSSASASKRPGFNSDPSAATPMPPAMRPKKCRRVSNSLCSRIGSIGDKLKVQSSKLKVQDKYQIQAPRIMHCGSFMTHGTKDKQKLMRLSVEDPRFRGEFRLGSDDHAQEKFRLLGFFHAAADRIFRILLRDSLIGLAIVGPYARTGTD